MLTVEEGYGIIIKSSREQVKGIEGKQRIKVLTKQEEYDSIVELLVKKYSGSTNEVRLKFAGQKEYVRERVRKSSLKTKQKRKNE